MKPSTMSLFEQEMRDQLAAARDGVVEAGRWGDPLLVQAATSDIADAQYRVEEELTLDREVPIPCFGILELTTLCRNRQGQAVG